MTAKSQLVHHGDFERLESEGQAATPKRFRCAEVLFHQTFRCAATGGLAVSPRKPRVPHCEKRPGAAPSRRDHGPLRVGGEPRKPRVPRCEERPLQEGSSVRCGLAVSPGNRGSHIARSGQEPHTPGGIKRMLRVGGEPRKPRVPHCEERPGAAHPRRDQAYVAGWR